MTDRARAEAEVKVYTEFVAKIHASNIDRHPERAARFVYKGPYDLLLKHGTFYDPSVILPDEWSGIIPVVERHCFDNAQRLALRFPEELRYVEGIAMNLLPTMHAWCITADGTVVDPTWAELDHPSAAYFGVPLDLKHVRKARKSRKISVLFSERDGILTKPYVAPR